MIYRILTALLIVLLSLPADAATYYVSNSGSDSNNGTSTGTPWQTLAKVSAETFSPGDSILLQDGGMWRETLVIPSEGTSGNQITFGNYGTGALPIINGANLLNSGWTTYTGSGSNTITASPGATDDSVYVQPSFSQIFVGYPTFGQEYSTTENTGNRFVNVTVPAAATITAASLTVQASGGTSGSSVSATIKGQESVTPATFSTYADYAARTQTTASVAWSSIPAWSSGSFTSPDITSVIQEIVNLGSWASGDNLVLFINDNSSPATNYRQFEGYGNGTIPVLSVTYTGSAPPNIWQVAATTQPQQVFFNGTLGTPVASTGSILAAGDWYWASNVLYVYSTSNPATAFTSPGIEASWRNDGVYAGGMQYVTIQNMEVEYSNQQYGSAGVYLVNNFTGDIVNNVTSIWNAGAGIGAVIQDGSEQVTSLLIENSTAAYNGYDGIMESPWSCGGGCGAKVTGLQILNNIAHHNAQGPTGVTFTAGIHFGTAPGYTTYVTQGCLVSGNISYYNGYNAAGTYYAVANAGAGIWGDTDETCTVEYNQAYHNTMGNIDMENGYQNVVEYNQTWGNSANTSPSFSYYPAGITISASATNVIANGNLIYNNTSYNDGYCIATWGDGGAPSTNTVQNNVFENNLCVSPTIAALVAVWGAENESDGVGTGSGNVYTYNNWGTASTGFIEWGWSGGVAPTYSTYASWEAASGNCGTTGCSHSVQTTATLTNGSGNVFTLPTGSSAIGSGANLGTTYNTGLMPAATWPSGVVTGSQGASWNEGAYLTPPTSLITLTGRKFSSGVSR